MFHALFFALVLIVTLLMPDTAEASCGERCQQKCRANPGPQTVANCMKLWSCINANYRNSARFEDRPPPAKCRHLFKPKKKR